MKKIVSIVLALALCAGACFALTSCGETAADYQVGICQLMVHDSLDQATEGFIEGLTEALKAEGKTAQFDTQVAGEANLCTTVVNTFTAKNVDLIMANATPALLAAANVTGTSDAVPFDEQAKMMIESLGLAQGDKVGVIYCTN